jgi:hypothetical protein
MTALLDVAMLCSLKLPAGSQVLDHFLKGTISCYTLQLPDNDQINSTQRARSTQY